MTGELRGLGTHPPLPLKVLGLGAGVDHKDRRRFRISGGALRRLARPQGDARVYPVLGVAKAQKELTGHGMRVTIEVRAGNDCRAVCFCVISSIGDKEDLCCALWAVWQARHA